MKTNRIRDESSSHFTMYMTNKELQLPKGEKMDIKILLIEFLLLLLIREREYEKKFNIIFSIFLAIFNVVLVLVN
ncbi:hypothetical protein [Lactococcus petauri]|uniref:hypothetical protein n=1 Tax=Lactococcus petauri TaxID=1940789 RepID=UPI0018A8A567|nr:hypothetical protein [Lactococcus petauri]MDC0826935.1 hypothetical protein [Lactococcus petauri]